MPSCHWQLGLCPLHKAYIKVYDCDPENRQRWHCTSFQPQLFRIRQILLLVLGQLLKKSQVNREEVKLLFFERPHREAPGPYGEVECPNDFSFQVIPSKVAWHVNELYWTLQIRVTPRWIPPYGSLLTCKSNSRQVCFNPQPPGYEQIK